MSTLLESLSIRPLHSRNEADPKDDRTEELEANVVTVISDLDRLNRPFVHRTNGPFLFQAAPPVPQLNRPTKQEKDS